MAVALAEESLLFGGLVTRMRRSEQFQLCIGIYAVAIIEIL